eukprot:scaffold7243_cov394-Prasinococcus_capsulatus_cf.AAC.9
MGRHVNVKPVPGLGTRSTRAFSRWNGAVNSLACGRLRRPPLADDPAAAGGHGRYDGRRPRLLRS